MEQFRQRFEHLDTISKPVSTLRYHYNALRELGPQDIVGSDTQTRN
jgi:hypothetical protein